MNKTKMISAFLNVFGFLCAQGPQVADEEARAIVRRSMALHERNAGLVRNYTFVERIEELRLDSQGRKTSTESRTYETTILSGIPFAAFATMWVQDVFSSAGNHWFVYNTSMLNFGSWANSIPWWTSYGEPGAMTSEPILFTPAAYVYIMVVGAVCG